MLITDRLRWVKVAISDKPKRSILSLIGIAIGVTTVILMSALGEGVKQYVITEFTQFGTNLIAITPGKTQTLGLSGILNTVRPLSLEDVASLSRLPVVENVIPMVMGNGVIKATPTNSKSGSEHSVIHKTRATDIFGTTGHAFGLWKMPLSIGQYLPTDYRDNAQVVVLGSRLKQELFGASNPLGQLIKVKQQRFKVIGVLASKGQFVGFDMDDAAYIPAKHALSLFNRESLMEIDLSYQSHHKLTDVVNSVKQHLIKKHKREDFTIVTQDEMLKTLDGILSTLAIATLALGLIALFVGSVGITSMALIQIKERQHEIGLLRALGESSSGVLILFLLESTVLSALGGICGFILSVALLFIIGLALPALELAFQLNSYLLGFFVALVTGLIAGAYPAFKAAQVPPIEALRAL